MNQTRAIITRPADQAQVWVQALQAQGVQTLALPLIAIGLPDDGTQMQAAWQRRAQFDVVMCVSVNAATYFYDQKEAENHILPAQHAPKNVAKINPGRPAQPLRLWATGAGTVQALLAAGVDRTQIDAPGSESAQWDSQALWALVQHQVRPAMRVLIVRGTDVGTPSASRNWLAQRLIEKGATVETVDAYQRSVPAWSAEQAALAKQACAEGIVWVFSSSQALTHLHRCVPGLDVGAARCVATHERIAQAARDAGFAVVCTSRPTVPELAQSIKSLYD